MFEDYFKDWNNLIDYSTLTPILEKVGVMYEYHIVTPIQKNVFKAFTSCPYKDLKVVVLAQDPYSQPDIATGIAFGNKKDTVHPAPSLEIIRETFMDEHYYNEDHVIENFDLTLESWAKQGVLLLNSALTVGINKPNSHIDLWRPFIISLLKGLNDNNPGLVYILLGGIAKTFERYIDQNKNLVLRDNHPSFYARFERRMSNKVFIRTNEYLENHYNEKIRWLNN